MESHQMNNDFSRFPPGDMEQQLWNYIDGRSSAEERSVIEKFLQEHAEWKAKYHELLEVDSLIHSSELEQPILRFTKNVMEEIVRLQIAPATKTYINRKIIWGLGIFFVAMVLGFLVYGFGQVDWSAPGDTTITDNLNKININK